VHPTDRPNPFLNRKQLTGTTRAEFIARVRRSLNHGDRSPAPGQPPALNPAVLRQVPVAPAGAPALVDRWQQKMTDNKATVHRLSGTDQPAVFAALDACLAKHTVKHALLNLQSLGLPAGAPTPPLRTQDSELKTAPAFPIADHLRARNIQTTEWTAPTAFADAYSADVAITDAPAGLADTGSLLVWSHQHFGRSSTLVTPIHITLLPASRILPDLIDGLQFVQQQTPQLLPSNIVVINGPSKTGDIEMKLVVGVHGPKFMYFLILDNI
jgi:hypothetical protein